MARWLVGCLCTRSGGRVEPAPEVIARDQSIRLWEVFAESEPTLPGEVMAAAPRNLTSSRLSSFGTMLLLAYVSRFGRGARTMRHFSSFGSLPEVRLLVSWDFCVLGLTNPI